MIGASCNKKTIQVGLLLYSTNDKVVNDLTKELKKNIGEEYELIICDAEKNQGKQNKQFIDLLENECDIFIVNLVDRLAAKSFIEKCEQKNLPIIFFNREPLEEDINSYDKAYYVGSDGAKIGEKQAQIIRGEGDKQAIEIWNKAAGVDADFFAFYRSLEAYKKSMAGDGNTSLVLSPDTEFFDYFKKTTKK